MREIKFRVWNPELKEMYILSKKEYLGGTGIYDDSVGHEKGIWMQYTGLKDRNGREIYEGDIVIAWSAGVKAICEVKWGRGRAGFFLYRKPNIAWNLSGGGKDYNEENVEVIGNIFQDGDLLDSEISKVDRD